MIFKVISHFILSITHLRTGSSDIISRENLTEKRPFSAESLTPLEHYPILATFHNLSLLLAESV